MGDEHVVFLEAAGIEEDLEALAGGELALAVLRVDAALAATEAGILAALLEFFDDGLHAVPGIAAL